MGTHFYVDFNIDLCQFGGQKFTKILRKYMGIDFYIDFIVDLCQFWGTKIYKILRKYLKCCPDCPGCLTSTRLVVLLFCQTTGTTGTIQDDGLTGKM